MNASDLQKIMRSEAEISAEQMAVVEELVDILPWFSCGQLLLLKAMKQQHHPFFDSRLAFASLYAADRGQLQRYLQLVGSSDGAGEETLLAYQPASLLADDGFELLDSDAICEAMVDELAEEPKIYGQLSLVYPEKKAYFATRFATASQAQRTAVFS